MDIPGFYIDMRLIEVMLNPRSSQSDHYLNTPVLRQIVSEITLQRIIECVFVIAAHDIRNNGLTAVLYEYMEHNCPVAMKLFEEFPDLHSNFNLLVDEVIQMTDEHLRQSMARYTNDYHLYVFDHWEAASLAAFVKVTHET